MEKRKFIVIEKDAMMFEPHPLNKEIYGEDELDDLFLEDIRENGVREPIVVNPNGMIISGHRRWKAAVKVGRYDIPVRVEKYLDSKEEEEALIAYNRQRVKSKSMVLKEIKQLRKIYKEQGLGRRLKNLKQFEESLKFDTTEVAPCNIGENDQSLQENEVKEYQKSNYSKQLKESASKPGRSNEKIAKSTGVSPRTVMNINKVLDATEHEDPEISEPAKEIEKKIEKGEMGYKPAAEKVNDILKAKTRVEEPVKSKVSQEYQFILNAVNHENPEVAGLATSLRLQVDHGEIGSDEAKSIIKEKIRELKRVEQAQREMMKVPEEPGEILEKESERPTHNSSKMERPKDQNNVDTSGENILSTLEEKPKKSFIHEQIKKAGIYCTNCVKNHKYNDGFEPSLQGKLGILIKVSMESAKNKHKWDMDDHLLLNEVLLELKSS